jgi:hypothetical protein
LTDDLLADFYAEVQDHGPRCTIGLARRQLSPDEVVKLDAALAAVKDQRLPATAVAAWLKKRDLTIVIGREAVARHLKGVCRCPTT